MGNSEVGHLNLGAGSIVKQDLLRIDEAVAAGELRSNDVLREAIEGFERVHLIGLVSTAACTPPTVTSGRSSRWRWSSACRISSSTRSPTGATPCRRAERASSPTSSAPAAGSAR
jgi:hypothetical protein